MNKSIFKKGNTVKMLRTNGHSGVTVGAKMKVLCASGNNRHFWLFNKGSSGHVGNVCPCGQHSWEFAEGDGEVVKSGKQLPVKFLLRYDLHSDPVEEYATLKEVKARIAELVKNEKVNGLKRDSIRVYEIKKTYPVKVETAVTIKGI